MIGITVSSSERTYIEYIRIPPLIYQWGGGRDKQIVTDYKLIINLFFPFPLDYVTPFS